MTLKVLLLLMTWILVSLPTLVQGQTPVTVTEVENTCSGSGCRKDSGPTKRSLRVVRKHQVLTAKDSMQNHLELKRADRAIREELKKSTDSFNRDIERLSDLNDALTKRLEKLEGKIK